MSVLWSKHYIAIARANLVIKNLIDSPIEQSVKEELEAEVRFVRAYAYFTTPRDKIITETADKRLKVLQSLDSLGAGFQLASHDLDIRAGAPVAVDLAGQ